MEELQCNIVVIKGSCAKVLRLNLGGVHNKPLPPFSLSSSYSPACTEKFLDKNYSPQAKKTASSCPVEDTAKKNALPAETRTVAFMSSESAAAPTSSFFVREQNPLFENKLRDGGLTPIEDVGSAREGTSGSEDNGGGSPPHPALGLKLPCNACEYLIRQVLISLPVRIYLI